jgi:hypothetical protein
MNGKNGWGAKMKFVRSVGIVCDGALGLAAPEMAADAPRQREEAWPKDLISRAMRNARAVTMKPTMPRRRCSN